jgi:hypothetical protein
LAEKKAEIASMIEDHNYSYMDTVSLMDTAGRRMQILDLAYPPSIEETLPQVIQKVGQTMKLSGKVQVRSIVTSQRRRIPFAKEFEIQPQ